MRRFKTQSALILCIIWLVYLLGNLFSCSSGTYIYPDNGKINIIASLFPQYDFAKHIAGDKANIVLLLPPGTESHMFDPKPSDMANIYNADLFLYTGEHMEPWAGEIVKGVPDSANLTVVDCSSGIELISAEDEADEGGEEHDGHDHELDPHIWLNPILAMKMADNILESLCSIDSENAEYYISNAEDYKARLKQLDEDIFAAIESGQRDVLVFGGRFAYIYFLKHFNLNYVTVYDSCSTNAEPSVKAVADVTDFIINNGIPCIYHEEFANAKIANSIAESANISCELFSTAHNVTKTDFDNGVTFIDVMYQNLENIKKGLN